MRKQFLNLFFEMSVSILVGVLLGLVTAVMIMLINKEHLVFNNDQNEAVYVTAIMNVDIDLDKDRAIEIYKEARKIENFQSVDDKATIDIEAAIGKDCEYEIKVYKHTVIYEDIEGAYRNEYLFTIKYDKNWNIIESIQ